MRYETYVYWTVHHLDSRIKIDQLDVTCFIISLFAAQHVSNVSTSILFLASRLTLNLDDHGVSLCLGTTLGLVRHGRPYQHCVGRTLNL